MEKLFPIHLIFRFFFYLLLEGVFLVFLTFNILIFCYKCFNFCPWFGWSVIYFNCCCCISAAYDTIRDDKAEIKNELLADHATKIVWLTTMLFTLLFSSLLIVKKEKHSLMNHDRQVKIVLISDREPTYGWNIIIDNINHQSINQYTRYSKIFIEKSTCSYKLWACWVFSSEKIFYMYLYAKFLETVF